MCAALLPSSSQAPNPCGWMPGLGWRSHREVTPVVRGLVIATSGRFSADAVTWAEQHNSDGAAPFIDLWPESKLETLLAQKAYLAAAHGLR